MISIYIPPYGYIDLYKDTVIRFSLNNPIFNDDNIIPGDYSLPFTIPGGEASANNARIFSHPDVIESTGPSDKDDYHPIKKQTTFDCRMEFDGLPFKSGRFVLSQASDREYTANFFFGFHDIDPTLKTKRIRDLIDEEIVITTEQYSKTAYIYGSANTENNPTYRIKINDKIFEISDGVFNLAGLSNLINADPDFTTTLEYPVWLPGLQRIKVQPSNNPTDPLTEFIVDRADELDTNMFVRGAPYQALYDDFEAFLDDLRSGTPTYDYLVYPQLINNNSDNSDKNVINKVNSEGYDFGIYSDILSPETGEKKGSPYMPFVLLKRIFDRISEEFNVSFIGDFYNEPDLANMFFLHNKSMWDDVAYIYGNDYRFYNTSFNVGDLVPDITIEEFLKLLQQKYNLAIVFNTLNRTIALNYRNPIIKGTSYTDWTSIAGKRDPINFVEKLGIRLEALKDDNDAADTDDIYIYDEVEDTKTVGLGSVKKTAIVVMESVDVTVPRADFKYDQNYKPRLLHYEGLRIHPFESYDYPYAELEGIPTQLQGPTGIGETEYKNYLKFLSERKEVSFYMKLEFRHLSQLDWTKKIAIDGQKYLIKSIDVAFTMTGIKDAKVTLYTV